MFLLLHLTFEYCFLPCAAEPCNDFDSKKDIFEVFRSKTASIKAYDGLKVAPTIAPNDVICLVN